jgi:hypothetical protein
LQPFTIQRARGLGPNSIGAVPICRISLRHRCMSFRELAICLADALPPVSFWLRKRSRLACSGGPYHTVHARNFLVAPRCCSSCRCILSIFRAAPSRSNTRPSCTPMSQMALTSVPSSCAAVSDENSRTALSRFPSRTEKPTERVSPAFFPAATGVRGQIYSSSLARTFR